MKAIDADSLIADCNKYLGILNPDRDVKEYARIFWLIGILRNAPTIEPEPEIVRCKECTNHGKEICYFWSHFYGTINTPDDGFCYKAERRTDD